MVSVITRINKVAHKAKVKEAFANVVVASLHFNFYSLNENLQRNDARKGNFQKIGKQLMSYPFLRRAAS